MIRRPLRPLASILSARAKGENPDVIEAENLRLRRESLRDGARRMAVGRLLVLAGAFTLGFGTIGTRMATLASTSPVEPQARTQGSPIYSQRADIVDRHGRVLATNIETHALYAQPHMMIDPKGAAQKLAQLFPDMDESQLLRDFAPGKKFKWLRRQLSPEQMQAVHDIGEPGLLFGPREMRIYPNGAIAAHALGGASFGRQAVDRAEVIGVAGVERHFDATLRDPARQGVPLTLSLDLSVQAMVEELLAGGMMMMNAKGAAAVMMDVTTGEVISLVSLPDFDPNNRPANAATKDPSDSPLFNRAVQGVYELGSVFKIFTAAQSLALGLSDPGTMVDTKGPLVWGKRKIRDFHRMDPKMSVTDVIVESSNVGTARLALEIGPERQRAFLDDLGLLAPTQIEMAEAAQGRPILPQRWSEMSAITISFGHGLSVSPLHLASAYATLASGGRLIKPTLIKGGTAPGDRVINEDVAAAARDMLRQVVTRGTASFGEVPGYNVAGKTGTADKPNPTGGYYEDRVIASFASLFPADAPRYVLVVMLDEPVDTTGREPRRTAGWTAVPVAAEIIRRTAPMLGLRPDHRSYAPLPIALTGD